MKYLGMALFLFVPIQFVYMMLTEAYKNFGIKLEKLQLAMKLYRYALAVGCLIAALFWQGAEPPVLDMSKVQTSEGFAVCENSSGRGKYGEYKMDGIKYVRAFSYVFGTGAGGTSCNTSINGHRTKIVWLPIYNNTERLILEVRNMDTNRIYGLTMEKKYELHKESVEDKTWLYVAKFVLFVFALHLAFWDKAVAMHQWINNKIKQ